MNEPEQLETPEDEPLKVELKHDAYMPPIVLLG